MKLLINNVIQDEDESHVTRIFLTEYSRQVKLTYRVFNSTEKYVGEFWTGKKWSPLFVLEDLGISANPYMFSKPVHARVDRLDSVLQPKALEYINALLP